MNLEQEIYELRLRVRQLEIIIESKCENLQKKKPRFFGGDMTDDEYDLFMEMNECIYPNWREIPNFGN